MEDVDQMNTGFPNIAPETGELASQRLSEATVPEIPDLMKFVPMNPTPGPEGPREWNRTERSNP